MRRRLRADDRVRILSGEFADRTGLILSDYRQPDWVVWVEARPGRPPEDGALRQFVRSDLRLIESPAGRPWSNNVIDG